MYLAAPQNPFWDSERVQHRICPLLGDHTDDLTGLAPQTLSPNPKPSILHPNVYFPKSDPCALQLQDYIYLPKDFVEKTLAFHFDHPEAVLSYPEKRFIAPPSLVNSAKIRLSPLLLCEGQGSGFSVQRSAISVQRSTFSVHRFRRIGFVIGFGCDDLRL